MLNVTAVGNVTRDLELKTVGQEKPMSKVTFTVACNHPGKEETTEFIDVEVLGTYADTCAKYLRKGSGVVVIGELYFETNEKDGKTYFKKVIKNAEVAFMDKKTK